MRNKGRTQETEPVFQGPGVSELLKTTRERAGQDLKNVAEVLRIRHVYLEAIEAGRFEDLPGKTYVVGFVRAYAEYLGLDAEEVVKRFKAEIEGLEGKAELVFPSPVTEQSVPGGAIILISLVLLGAAYGGWYFLSSQDRSVAELVPDLPAKFAEMVERVKGTQQPEEDAKETKKTSSAPAQEEKGTKAVSEVDTQDMAQKAREAVEKAENIAEEVVSTVETVKVEDATKKVEEVTETAEHVVEEKIDAAEKTVEKVKDAVVNTAEKAEETTETVVEKPVEKIEETAEKVEDAIVETTKEVVEQTVEEETTAAPEPMTEKVVLKAVDYAWFQIVDGDGSIIHTQVLNEGEEYQVPAKQGLILRTGNAGGLEIFVDGKKAPSIGAVGDVRRKVLIDPTKLLDGTAVEN